MADLRQNSSVLGKLTVTGGGASNPFHVTGGDIDASTDYDLLKLLDTNSGSIFRINRQNGTSLFEVLTTGTQIGGAYTLPHSGPAENQILTRATGAAAGVVSWEDLPSQVGGYDVALGGVPSGGQALLFDDGDNEWYAGNQTVIFPGLDGTTDVGDTTDNTITVGGLNVRETAVTGSETDSIVITTTDTLETNDLLGGLVWTANNSAASVTDFAKLYTKVSDATNASEDSTLTAKSYRAGTEEIGLEVHGNEVRIADAYIMPLADGTAGQVIKTDASGNLSFADVASSTAVNDLTDVSTTGIADGDGIKYNGTTYVAGKWGVGAENQVLEANQSTASTTARTIELDTTVDLGNSQVFSITTLDLVDNDANRLERCQVTSVDVGSGPTTSILQEKYGQFYLKRDANSTTDPKMLFSYQYAPGGTTAGIGISSAPSNTYCLYLPSSTSSQVTGQTFTVKSGSTTDAINLELTSITLDSATDLGATTTNSITTGSQTINGSDDLIPGIQYNYTGTSEIQSLGIALNADNIDVGDALPIITWSGPDAASNSTTYGAITCVPTDKTNGSEDSYFAMGSMKDGDFVKGFKVAGDLVTIGIEEDGDDYTLPNSRGTGGYVLTTDGSGATSWAAASGGSSSIMRNYAEATYVSLSAADADNYYFPGSTSQGLSGTLGHDAASFATSNTWNKWRKCAHFLEAGTWTIKVNSSVAVSTSTGGTGSESVLLGEDIGLRVYLVSQSGTTDTTVATQIGVEQVTQYNATESNNPVTFTEYTITGQSVTAGQRLMIVFKGTTATSMASTRYFQFDYDVLCTKTA